MTKINIYLVTILWILNNNYYGYCKDLRKRQIYREQVLPHAGGKIPDTAFHTDRLALNRLQTDGIAVPDGIILQQRNPQVFQYPNKAIRPVFKVRLTSDNRYTPRAGQYHSEPSVETTYSIPQYINNEIVPQIIVKPVHKTFILPNRLLQGSHLHPVHHHQVHHPTTTNYGGAVSSSHFTIYPNFAKHNHHVQQQPQPQQHLRHEYTTDYDDDEIGNNDLVPLIGPPSSLSADSSSHQPYANQYYQQNDESDIINNYEYIGANLFKDFDTFFNTFTNRIEHHNHNNNNDEHIQQALQSRPQSAISSQSSTTHSYQIHH